MAKLSGKKITGKQWTPKEEPRNMTKLLSQSGGNRVVSIEILSKSTDGLKNISDTWTTSRRSTFLTSPPWHQRQRYERTITLACNDEGRQVGPMTERKDFKPFAQVLASLRQEQGRQNFFSPKNERMRQRRFDDASRAELERMSQKMEDLFHASFYHFNIFTTTVRAFLWVVVVPGTCVSIHFRYRSLVCLC